MSSGRTLQMLPCHRPREDDFVELLSRKKGLARGNPLLKASMPGKAAPRESEPMSGVRAALPRAWSSQVGRDLGKPFSGRHRWLELLYHDNLASLMDKTSRQLHYGFDATRPYTPAASEHQAYAAELWRCLHAILQRERPSTPHGLTHSEFARLAESWKAETAHLSSITKAAMHPAYQRIVGLGTAALPLILRELRDEPRQWFWALKAISGEDPVDPEDRGNVRKMREAWLEWGKARGHIR